MRFALLILAALPLAAATDVSGKWIVNGDVYGNAISMTCSFKQDAAAKVSGKCSLGTGGEVDVAGAVKEQTITFSYSTQGYDLTYTGKVDGDNVSGEIAVAGVTGTFSGKRDTK